MKQKRQYIRIPISADVTLSNLQTSRIKVKAVNISEGGITVTTPPQPFSHDTQYHVQLDTPCGNRVQMVATLIHQADGLAGFKSLLMDKHSKGVIENLALTPLSAHP